MREIRPVPFHREGAMKTNGQHGLTGRDLGETIPTPVQISALRIGGYDVVSELGEGGMGRVYKAVDNSLGRFVAIKVLRSNDPFECSRFRGEAELIASLDHPNIIKIFAIETTPDGRPYLVLEFAEGGSLDRELAGQPQEPRRAAEMIETLALAVHFAHEKGVIHRDLKPANILRTKDKTLKLTDFGLAKELEVSSGMTPSGAVMGTPSYMAPEQAEGKVKQLGRATDVYGLGAILYELLTGRPPFRGVNIVDTLEQVRWVEPASPSRLVPRLHRDLTTICLKCLQKTPSRRYQTALELAEDLRRWLNGETITARPAPSWERAWRQVCRRPWQTAAVVAIAMLIGLTIAGGIYLREKNAEESRRIEREAAEQRLRTEKELANQTLIDTQAANAKRLREHAERSLRVIRQIYALIGDGGELSRIEGLEPLHAALLTYYQEVSERADSGYDPVELADGFIVIGDLYRRTGDKTKARDAYAKAESLCRPLTTSEPKARLALATARLKSGRIALELGDEAATQKACNEAQRLWEGLSKETTSGDELADAARQLAEVWHLRGELLGQKRNFPESSQAYQTAIELRKKLVGDSLNMTVEAFKNLPVAQRKKTLDYLRDLGRGYGYHGDVLLELNPAAADRAYWNSHAIRTQVVKLVPHANASIAETSDAQQQLARSWGNFTEFQTRARAFGTARHFAKESLEVHRALLKTNPNNVEYRLDLCTRLNQLAELSLLLGDVKADEIQELLDEARTQLPLDDSNGKGGRSRGARGTLANTLVLLAQLHATTNNTDAAKAELVSALELLNDLCRERAGTTVNPSHRFLQAAALALDAELNGVPANDPRWTLALDALELAIVTQQYRDRHPDHIEQLRAFEKIKSNPRFKKILDTLRPKPLASP
jgi:tetratricopeptide (TPR) repeat protein